jgi:hypothetical protein
MMERSLSADRQAIYFEVVASLTKGLPGGRQASSHFNLCNVNESLRLQQ